jgi:hypothetical protein
LCFFRDAREIGEDFLALVLVIDDDRTICDAIAMVVHQIGHEARCASTFSKGLEESRQ